jgi:hypothetical protein
MLVYVGLVVNSVALEQGFATLSGHIYSTLTFSLPLILRWVSGLCPRLNHPVRGFCVKERFVYFLLLFLIAVLLISGIRRRVTVIDAILGYDGADGYVVTSYPKTVHIS